MASCMLIGRRRCGQGHIADRRGAIVVLAAFLMIAMLACMALAIDFGYLLVARTELQRTADSSALAAAWQLASRVHRTSDQIEAAARDVAVQYAADNRVLNASPSIDRNDSNAADGDVVLGTIDDLGDFRASFYQGYPDTYNAVRVRVRRTAQKNGVVPFFFARALGVDGAPAEAIATAAILRRVSGFRPPASGENLPFLPIAVHLPTWNELMSGTDVEDEWSYRADHVQSGPDGVPELILYPETNRSPGNFGTVDVDHSGLPRCRGLGKQRGVHHRQIRRREDHECAAHWRR